MSVADNLGKDWIILETLYRIYSISGYNLAHIDVTAALCSEHDIKAADIESIEAVVNWLETQYPSPAFPVRREDLNRKPGSTAYHLAYAAATRGYPMLGKWEPQTARADDPRGIPELTQRVSIVPSHTMGLFAPRITITTKDGKSYTKQGTGREFIWDYEEQAKRIRAIESGLPIAPAQFAKIIDTCRTLEQQPRADALIALMQK